MTRSRKRSYRRRTHDEMVADLEAKIREVRKRQAALTLKSSPAWAAAVAVVRALNKASSLADEEGDRGLSRAMERARRPVVAHFAKHDVSLPATRAPRGRARKA